MVNQIAIELKNLRFFAHHGFYKNEKETGNEFEVNLKVIFKPGEKVITSLDESVNYEKIFALLKLKMKKPVALLETLVMEIAAEIHQGFEVISEIEVSITKFHPSIENFRGNVAVTYRKQF